MKSIAALLVGAAVLAACPAGAQTPPPTPALRLGAIPAEKMTEAQTKAAGEILQNGAVPAYLWPMMRNPGLAPPTKIIGEYLNRQGKLPPRLTQMVILIASRRLAYNGSWAEHSGMAARAQLSNDIVQAIAAEKRPATMDEDETLVYDMCDEMQKTMTISDATYAHAVARLGEPGVVDTVAIYGFYSYLGLFSNVSRAGTPVFRNPPPTPAPAPAPRQ